VLFIHGFGGDLGNWLFNLDALAEAHAGDRARPARPRPESDPAAGHDARRPGGFVARFLDQLEVERVHLIGHSMGGAIAARLATRPPARVASLALVNSAGLGGEINPATPRASSPRPRGAS
jgi:pyruvate dehydrogenase E2 component (dihydrolipoamide acetyltransferase)